MAYNLQYPIFYRVPEKVNWRDIPEMLRPESPNTKGDASNGCIRLVNGRLEMAHTFVETILLTKTWPPKVFSDGWTTTVWIPIEPETTIWLKGPKSDIDVILPVYMCQEDSH